MGELRMDVLAKVLDKIHGINGVVSSWVLPDTERGSLETLEMKSNHSMTLPGLEAVNTGLTEVLKRKHVIVVAHSRALRDPPDPTMLICSEESVLGQLVQDSEQIEQLMTDPNAICLGKGFFLYIDAIQRAKGRPLKLVYPGVRFPELEDVEGIRDIVSVTIGAQGHNHLLQIAGWNTTDSDLATLLVGFNDAEMTTERGLEHEH
jgi:hypothetical protein